MPDGIGSRGGSAETAANVKRHTALPIRLECGLDKVDEWLFNAGLGQSPGITTVIYQRNSSDWPPAEATSGP